METAPPTDRFDDIPEDLDRVGAHRAPVKRGRGWIAFAWAALATGVLVLAGVLGLAAFSDSISIDLPFESSASAPAEDTGATEEAPVETVEPALDPTVAISVLNGTANVGLAGVVGDSLVEAGWGGAAADVGTRANAATDDVATTVVYYQSAEQEAAALALVQSLGVGEIRLSQDYPSSPITVLIGADYPLPAE